MRYLPILLIFSTLSLFAQQKGVTPIASTGEGRPEGVTRAVVVGISDYQNENIPDLRFADKDAEAFAKYLKSPAGGNLNDEQLKILLNEEATTAQIAAALEWLVEVSEEGDRVVIYFSGHGDVETKSMFQLGYLLTWDSPSRTYVAGAFPLQYLQAMVTTLSVQNKARVALITDACRAGKLAGTSVGGAQITNANLSKQFAGEVKILSCQADEFSLEGEQWGGGRGAFSYHLVDGLYGLADNNSDGKVNLFEIGRFLEDKVSGETAPHSQFPMIVGSKSTTMAKVDAASLAQLKERRTKETPVLATVESKGFEDMILADLDSIWQKKYRQFTAAVEEGHLLDSPAGKQAAYDIYLELQKAIKLKKLHGTIRRNLAAALQDDAQQAINAYLETNPSELAKRYESESDYERYPRYLRKAAEILGTQNFYYPYVMAKLYYFEGLQMRLDADKEVENASYEKAIELQTRALEFQEYAPFVLNELGVLHTRQKLSEKAVDFYEKAIETAPEWGLPYINLCLEHFYNNDLQQAITMGDRAIELMPNYPQLYNLLAWVNANQSGEYNDKRDWDRLGVELKEDFSFDYDNTSSFAEKKRKYKRTIELLQKAVDLDSLYAAAHRNLAFMYCQTGKDRKALSHLKKVNQFDSGHHQTYALLGHAYTNLTESDRGISAYKKAIELALKQAPEHVAHHYNGLGKSHRNRGSAMEALEAYEKALTFNNRYEGSLTNSAGIYRELGEFEKAEARILRYKEVSGESNPHSYIRTGWHFEHVNRFADSEWMFLRAIEIYPNYRWGIKELIDLYQKTGYPEKALAWQEKLLTISEEDPDTHLKAGELAYLNKQKEKAIEHFDKAVSLSPNQPGSAVAIAGFLRIHDEAALAEKYLQPVFKMDVAQDYAYCYWMKAFLLADDDRPEEAIDFLDQGLAVQKIKGQRVELQLMKISLAYNAKKYEECLIYCRQFEEEAPHLKGMFFLFQQLIAEEYAGASLVLEKLLKSSNNTNPEGHFINCTIQTKLGNYEAALASLKIAAKSIHFRRIENNPDLTPLRKRHEYRQIMRENFPEKFDDLDTFDFKKAEGRYYFKNCITLAKYYESQGEYVRAKWLREKAEELKPAKK